jgi:hypothetical protein
MESFKSKYVLHIQSLSLNNFGLYYKVRFDPKIRGMVATAPIKKNEKLVSVSLSFPFFFDLLKFLFGLS